MLQRSGRLLAEVPFAKVAGGVAALLEGLGEGFLLVGQVRTGCGVRKFLGREIAATGQPVGELKARGVFARQDAGARGRADVAGRVGIGEPHVGAGETVKLRGFVERAALDAKVAPAEVVDEEEDDVGRARGRGGVERSGEAA